MHTYSECPVCHSSEIHTVLEAVDYTVSNEKFSISECNSCTFRFTNPIPIQEAIGKYYQSEDYISHSNTSKGIINRIYQMVRNYTLNEKRSLVKKVSGKPIGTILDIGCGTGDFLGRMKKAGWEVTGVEPDEGARGLANQNNGIQPRKAEELFDLPENAYDVVTMWHVLEHVHELDRYMERIDQMLKADGVLIIAVPNYCSFDSDYYQEVWAAYDVPRHLYHFNLRSIKTLLKRFGFSLQNIRIMPFDSFYVAMLSEKYRKGGIFSAIWVGLRSWLKSLSKAERSSSIIYLVSKENEN